MSPVPSTVLQQQPYRVSYAARSTSTLSSTCGMRQDVSVFKSSKKEEWQHAKYSCGGEESSWKKLVKVVSVRGEGRSNSEGCRGGQGCMRVGFGEGWSVRGHTRLLGLLPWLKLGLGSVLWLVADLARALLVSQKERVSSCDESGLRVNRLKTIV
ncbi:hypothetical protein BDR07DRAFT_171497 [Suillus spraguei]|nr:hypothetical protein BDR07DRAFT_171497 [Suillus spraguei]